MKIERVTVRHVRVPLRVKFRTAETERSESESVIAQVTLDDGTKGFGEGVPREYVTSETPATCIEFSRAEAPKLRGKFCTSFAESAELASEIGFGPEALKPQCAARAALEIALLDAAARHFSVSLSSLVTFLPDLASIARRNEEVRYGVVLSAGSGAFKGFLYRLYGFRDVKVKVGTDAERDAAMVARMRRALGKRIDLRVDANGGWSPKDAAKAIRRLAACDVSFVEQPVAPAQMMELAELRRDGSGPPVMLDESLVSERDAQLAVSGGLGEAFNLRISKNGGMIPLMHLAKLALDARIGIQLGCHPGETGILSAAGRAIACSVRNLLYLEGSYDRHILARNVIDEDITFGKGGRARRLSGPGLGVTVRMDELDALTLQKVDVA